MNKVIFDNKTIVLSFAAVSDIHLTGENDDSAEKFSSAIKMISETARENGREVDAFLVSGDLIDCFRKEPRKQVEKFRDIYFSLCQKPIIYSLGDGHDLFWGRDNESEMINMFSSVLGEKNFVFDIDKDSIKYGNRHAVLNGYHFIALEPCSRGPITYSEETKKWFESALEKAEKENPGKYIFVSTHPMIYDTCYGSTLGNVWDTDDLTGILSKHKNVVIFGGHLHFPLNDERSIMQTSFTSIGCGSVRYMAIEDAAYENMASKTTMHDRYSFSQGLLCEVDKNGALSVTRIDFYNKSKIKEPWIIPAPAEDGSHLALYGKNRCENSEAPYFPDDFVLETEFYGESEEKKLRITFTAAKSYDMVHHYKIEVSSNRSCKSEYRVLSDFYRHPSVCDMSKTVTFLTREPFCRGDFVTVDITAVDSFGKEAFLKKNFLVN